MSQDQPIEGEQVQFELRPALQRLAIDLPNLVLGFIGALIGIGTLTLHQSHQITGAIGLLLIVLAATELLTLKLTFPSTPSRDAAYLRIAIVYTIFVDIAIINAIINMVS